MEVEFCLFVENDKPMKVLRQQDLVNQELITDLRKEFRMTYDEFYMALTDMDMKWKVRWCRFFFLGIPDSLG